MTGGVGLFGSFLLRTPGNFTGERMKGQNDDLCIRKCHIDLCYQSKAWNNKVSSVLPWLLLYNKNNRLLQSTVSQDV